MPCAAADFRAGDRHRDGRTLRRRRRSRACSPARARTACSRAPGTPYLALELRDRTGALAARVFRDADVLAGRFDRGDLVRVAGRVERFRDELQAELRAIARAEPGEADPAAFLPVAYRDLDELDGFLEHLAGEVRHPAFRALLGRRAGRRRAARRAARHALHAQRPPRLPRRPARAHGRRGDARGRDLRPAPAARPGPAADRRRRPRPRRTSRASRSAPRSGSATRAGCSATSSSALRMLEERAARTGLDDARHLALAHCVLTHHGADARPGRRFAWPRRSRCTGSTRSTRPSRARSSTGSSSTSARPRRPG